MIFDNYKKVSCEANSPAASAAVGDCSGGVDIPSTDERCGDPVFAAENPDLCKDYPQLLIKPDSAIVEPGKNVSYRAFLRQGHKETELTKGLTWNVSEVAIAEINQLGVATGVGEGICTVSVTWQTWKAYANLEVVVSCAATSDCFLLCLDTSKSSGQQFSATYGTKLQFARTLADSFIDFLNASKDTVAVMSFASSAQVIQESTEDQAAAKAAVDSITGGTGKTNIYQALKTGTDYLNTLTDKRRILILITDGEISAGPDPVALAKEWRQGMNTILVVALRSSVQAFATLYEVASGGYFLSAYGTTAYDTIRTVTGLKSFLCAGGCQPVTGTYPKAELDYAGFANWDVTGYVDLVGLGNIPEWDVDPGHGLYVDMAGTDLAHKGAGARGTLTSKEAFDFTSGKDYEFQLNVGGNRRGFSGSFAIKITIGTFLTQTITVSNPDQSLTDSPNPYVFPFTAGSTASAHVVIELLEQPVNRHPMVGLLVDEILLTNVTDDVILLDDDFDSENLTTVTGGAYYYGCLETPPGAQAADPTPPPLIQE